MEKSYREWLTLEIADTQAKLDDVEMFGGSPEEEAHLKIYLAELQNENARDLTRDEPAKSIILETGAVLGATSQGGWGRLHYVTYAVGSRKLQRDFWICAGCQNRIHKGAEHYRRSYYSKKSDCRTGKQIRLCLECYEEHASRHSPSTTFPVRTHARRPNRERNVA